MEITIQEVNYYNYLVSDLKAEPILCPHDDLIFYHIVVPSIENDEKVFFNCITCNTKFYPGINLIQKIKSYIDKMSLNT